MNLARIGNKYLAEQEPWKLIKSDEKRVRTIMNISLQISANLAIVCEPFIPFTSKKLFGLLNLSELKAFKQAATYYKKAVDKSTNKFTSPMFLKKLGLVNENLKDFKGAESAYSKIKSQFPESQEAQMIDAYIARANAQIK